jgi:cytoskeleton protein RodZ
MSDQQHIPSIASSEDVQSQSTLADTRPTPPGLILAAERQARGWSVEYVASHLKLAIRQVHALEEDRYDALPNPVVIRGFIRIYAKMLNIDSDPLVAGLPPGTAGAATSSIRPSRTLSTPFSESSLPLRGHRELPVGRIVWPVFGVLLIAAIFGAVKYGNWDDMKNSSMAQKLHFGSSSKADNFASPVVDASDTGTGTPSLAVADSDSTLQPSEVPASTQSGGAAPVIPPAVASTSPPEPVSPATTPRLSAATAASATTADSTVSSVTAVATAATPPPTVSGMKSPLQLSMSQDSWVEIRRPDNSVMVSRIMKAGTTEAFDIATPGALVVGNAAGVTGSLRGKPLSISSASANNVARLDLK